MSSTVQATSSRPGWLTSIGLRKLLRDRPIIPLVVLLLALVTVLEVLQPGMHGTTFGGNPVACAAGAAVLEELIATNLMQQVTDNGAFFTGRLMQLCSDFPAICKETRGKGLMLGLELAHDGAPVVAAMRERGILINCTDTTVLRFLPPLIVTRDQIRETIDVLRSVLATGV